MKVLASGSVVVSLDSLPALVKYKKTWKSNKQVFRETREESKLRRTLSQPERFARDRMQAGEPEPPEGYQYAESTDEGMIVWDDEIKAYRVTSAKGSKNVAPVLAVARKLVKL
jgi:hypothetical protein